MYVLIVICISFAHGLTYGRHMFDGMGRLSASLMIPFLLFWILVDALLKTWLLDGFIMLGTLFMLFDTVLLCYNLLHACMRRGIIIASDK